MTASGRGEPLLDMQLLIWLATAPHRLPDALRSALSDRRRPFWFSVASLWEVAIKTSLGKPGFQVDARQLRQVLQREGLQECSIEAEHCLAVQQLPWIHRDPFDRLLVAQAQCRDLVLFSCDRTLMGYGTAVRWAGPAGPQC